MNLKDFKAQGTFGLGMVRRCPKCGSKMLKDSTAVVKLRALDARYYCTNCGYFGALVGKMVISRRSIPSPNPSGYASG